MRAGYHEDRWWVLRTAGLCVLGALVLLCAYISPRLVILHAQNPQTANPPSPVPDAPRTAPDVPPVPSAPAGQTVPADEAQEQRPPTFRLEANYVRVDAYPTDNGQPVPDLTAGDFELLEDGVPQRIEQFERVQLSTITARDERRDPNTVAEGRAQAGDPRRRVFVIFLDTHHTTYVGSHRARKPLITMLERLIGPDDLYAVMTPAMTSRDIVFARKTELFDAALEKYWTWGQRDALNRTDPEEQQLEMCFPEDAAARSCVAPGGRTLTQEANAYQGVASQLIRRKRELETMSALEDLVNYLGIVREERKAVITVTQGWQLYRRKPELAQLQGACDPAPGIGGLGTGPDGRITTNRESARAGGSMGRFSDLECHERAVRYAELDNYSRFTELMERANRFNVSFYPFDSRGLAASDTQIGDRDERIRNDPGEWPDRARDPRGRTSLGDDQLALNRRLDSMRTLADNTDGIAIINTNDLNKGARRIVDDLSTYYLLGYYSSNRDLDGKWRKITVRATRPGVEMRARRGYRALRPEDMLTASPEAVSEAGGGVGDAAAAAEAAAVGTAVGSLAAARDGLPMYSRAASFFADPASGDGAGRAGHVWVTSEIDPTIARQPGWAAGGTLTASMSTGDGTSLGETEAALAPGSRAVATQMTLPAIAPGGEIVVRLRLRGAEGTLPFSDVVRVSVPAADAAVIGTPRLQRAGPVTARKFVAAADPRFQRSEKVRVEVPVAAGASEVTASLLDRTGALMAAIPVKAALVAGENGAPSWATAELALAPLSAGDYLIRVSVTRDGSTAQSLTGVRIVQ